MTGAGIFCIACGLAALYGAWVLRGLWGCVFALVLAATYLAVGVVVLA